MKTVTVTASRSYDILIEPGILKDCGGHIKSHLSPSLAAVVTDDIVDSLYAETVVKSLEANGIKTVKFVFQHGEASKCFDAYSQLIGFLADNRLTRTDAVVALGGGVTGDLAGFAAATYLRGIGLVQIPTTLLAMVDSSVGGKTAIDLPSGKNLCGAFYQPHLVLCDYEVLSTLTSEVFLDGCAEIIKYGCIGNPELLEHLQHYSLEFDKNYVIPLCIGMKRDVVSGDEFDRGNRQLLNFGHTVGHVIENLSEFKVSHGAAVAMGMVIMAESAAASGLCSNECRAKIQQLVHTFGFQMHHGFDWELIKSGFASDKKRSGNSITAVVPTGYGKCQLGKMDSEEFSSFIETGVLKWK